MRSAARRAATPRPRLLVQGCDPGGYLGPRIEAELVQGAADVAVNGALGDEQARPDLPIGQAVGDQPRDFGFPFPERSGAGLAGDRGGSLCWLAERKRQRRVPVQALSG